MIYWRELKKHNMHGVFREEASYLFTDGEDFVMQLSFVVQDEKGYWFETPCGEQAVIGEMCFTHVMSDERGTPLTVKDMIEDIL